MNTQQITAQLVAVHAALVEKLGEQPSIAPYITLRQSGEWFLPLYKGRSSIGFEELVTAKGDTPESCIKVAFDFLAAMPDLELVAKQAWQKSLGKVIDDGHALGLPDDVMQPLRQGSQSMTENLIAAPVKS